MEFFLADRIVHLYKMLSNWSLSIYYIRVMNLFTSNESNLKHLLVKCPSVHVYEYDSSIFIVLLYILLGSSHTKYILHEVFLG